MDKIKVTFQSPVQLGDDVVTELELREPKFEDLDGIPLDKINDAKYLRILVSRISGVEIALLKKLKMADALELFKALSSFFPSAKSEEESLED